jgi:hypothetical protein
MTNALINLKIKCYNTKLTNFLIKFSSLVSPDLGATPQSIVKSSCFFGWYTLVKNVSNHNFSGVIRELNLNVSLHIFSGVVSELNLIICHLVSNEMKL